MKIEYKIQVGLPEISKDIRNEVFCIEEGYHVDLEDKDKICTHIVQYIDGKAAGTARLERLSSTEYKIGRFAILKEYRHLGLGSKLLKETEDEAKRLGAKVIVLDAQYDKKDFYLKNGFVSNHTDVFLDENYPHIRLKKDL